MPILDVTMRGKTYRVEIPDPGATPLQVIVDGEPFEVEISAAETAAAARPAPPPPPAPVAPSLPPLAPGPTSAPPAPTGGHSGGNDVIAPLPGTILSIEVRVGDLVEAGQIVCVLEAMKMKNPIRATRPGRVVQVYAQLGQTVPHGAMLVQLA